MSRIGKQPIEVPDGVNVAVDPGRVTVNGPLGELTQNVPIRITIEKEDGQLLVKRPTDRGDDRALHGLTRSLVANMVEGVTNGFEKRLEIQGVGYRAALRGTALELNVGYSHSVVIEAPAGIEFEVPDADRDPRQGHRQAAGRGDRGRDPRRSPARALQGQGNPLPGRVRAPEGRKEGLMATLTVREARLRRHRRVRKSVVGTAERPRLAVFRSNSGIEAQLIDDHAGKTLAAASSLHLKKSFKGNKTAQAAEVGKTVAEAAKKAGIESVVFDRGGYLYHGRVKALADAAREGGLKF